jgi:hypothetical protein|tara:strand:- start:8336 stop:8911 length:576 start_codon:yes stop_codon:yes gene_type:complete
MKNIYKLLLLILLCSCEKEYPLIECENTQPTTQEPTTYVEVSYLEGDWLLIDGDMFMVNLDLDIEEEIFHFGSGMTSSLRYPNPYYDFEVITRYQTIWSFIFPLQVPGFGSFVLNNDTLSPYGLNVTDNYITVLEPLVGGQQLMGGSSRPLVIERMDVVNGIIDVLVQESYDTIDGYNYRYYSILTFRKVS